MQLDRSTNKQFPLDRRCPFNAAIGLDLSCDLTELAAASHFQLAKPMNDALIFGISIRVSLLTG